ncbi:MULTISPECIES: DNA-binding protein [Saccharopolyspora]|uniref:DNA-binding protein n=1 Tax=Saccharopolyspora gregorii TaxID=33914 RepID=A0ABP6RSY6_9PSEU|nr:MULTISPECIES: DNA-binding protein [Saccharopolyspora]MCA1188085.1 DNA-binding protein [Saccharopolyspora sp. 6T]MCA1194020.1 DNA-binding protein [Saccharopolyspora sp. 6V]MCA1225644.1 DNA-binding protein [Saccharopolyspora sp. 6M]MCA1281266.1 DNA-binding protein [Saccharopolyspora sp. 7B]
MTVALETILARAGLRVTANEFLSLVEDAAKRLITPQVDPSAHFTTAEREALAEAGLDLAPLATDETDPRARTVAEQAVLRDTALSVNQAAERIGVDSSRIRHRIGDGRLIGWKDRGGWRLPAWQFSDDDVLPGLETVLAGMPQDQPALVLAKFMTTAQDDLELGDRPVSPREWLLAGGSARRVADLASAIGTPA